MRTASANGGRADRKPGARAPQRRSDDEAARQGFHPPALLFATRSPVLRHGTTAVTGRAPTPDSSVVAPAHASTPRGTQKKRLVDFIRGADHLADRRREGEERNDVIPAPPPGLADRRIAPPPRGLEVVESGAPALSTSRAGATWTALLRTRPSSRTLTRSASKKTTG